MGGKEKQYVFVCFLSSEGFIAFTDMNSLIPWGYKETNTIVPVLKTGRSWQIWSYQKKEPGPEELI